MQPRVSRGAPRWQARGDIVVGGYAGAAAKADPSPTRMQRDMWMVADRTGTSRRKMARFMSPPELIGVFPDRSNGRAASAECISNRMGPAHLLAGAARDRKPQEHAHALSRGIARVDLG